VHMNLKFCWFPKESQFQRFAFAFECISPTCSDYLEHVRSPTCVTRSVYWLFLSPDICLKFFFRDSVWILLYVISWFFSLVFHRFLCEDILWYGQIFHHSLSLDILQRRQEGNKMSVAVMTCF
jgi:hypothetical protein